MASVNQAFWQDKPGIPGAIRASPIPSEIEDDQIVVKAHAWALNPCDHILQDVALPFIQYPLILGEDVAGTVVQVGSVAASKFKVGDRVTGLALGPGRKRSEQSAFQNFVIHDYLLVCKIPDIMSFSEASVFPLCLATAAVGLYSKEWLGLSFPKVKPTTTGQSILIWGGSSAVGSNAIQLCKHSGFEVISTCSPRNFEYVKSIGADKVFDYTSPTVIEDVVKEIDKGTCAGILQAAGEVKPPVEISGRSKQNLLVATTNPVEQEDAPDGVQAKMIFGTDVTAIYHETCRATFDEFLPHALAAGQYKVAPPADILKTKGIIGLQEAIDILRNGVSAKKIVVEV
ncbi:hypothetical protein FH972_022405 [Carpinus fangiana]|uniref:Enoyl reductase (ER) domain-containing protein n=1 Tax=Carpinus fangiana TaxID=176857 RepID=A0A5N6KS67_9ROSI|nr:hypothetical protein FH972_022405 [Carpinus fangiana]